MVFNSEIHQIKLIIIQCGRELRKAKGQPDENNISILYEEASEILGIPTIQTTTRDASELPEERRPDYRISPPSLIMCPHCGLREVRLFSLCSSCQESEGGKFKTKLICHVCGYEEKTEKPVVVFLQEMGIDFGNQSKESLGIKTITDDGIK